MRDIGKNIKAARVRRGLTQDELAAPVAVWNICQTVQMLLRGPGGSLEWNLCLPRWWDQAVIGQLHVVSRFPALVPFGAALWCTGPDRRERTG